MPSFTHREARLFEVRADDMSISRFHYLHTMSIGPNDLLDEQPRSPSRNSVPIPVSFCLVPVGIAVYIWHVSILRSCRLLSILIEPLCGHLVNSFTRQVEISDVLISLYFFDLSKWNHCVWDFAATLRSIASVGRDSESIG